MPLVVPPPFYVTCGPRRRLVTPRRSRYKIGGGRRREQIAYAFGDGTPLRWDWREERFVEIYSGERWTIESPTPNVT